MRSVTDPALAHGEIESEINDSVANGHADGPTPQSNLWRPPKTVQVGGQALVEGVMMRSPRFIAASVRRTDGSITTRLEPVSTLAQKHKWARLPFVRGVIGLIEMMTLGTKFLRWSGDIALEDEGKDKAREPEKLPAWAFFLTALTSLAMGIVLFVVVPHFIAGVAFGEGATQIARKGEGGQVAGRVGFNLFEGVIKLSIFIAYVWLIGKRKSIARIFEYHGAEHKVVYAVENNLDLTPEAARPFDTPHPRCGTGFAMLTIIVSVLCFSFLPVPGDDWGSRFLGALYRIGLMPVVAGVSYEVIKLTTHPRWQKLAVFVLTPGLWLQRLTTRQPDDPQLEVACEAMRTVLEAEGANPVAKPGMV